MNPNATVDTMIAQMGKPQPQATIKFTKEEIVKDCSVAKMVEARITVLMTKEVLTPLDVQLLEVLLQSTP